MSINEDRKREALSWFYHLRYMWSGKNAGDIRLTNRLVEHIVDRLILEGVIQ